jgi:hypothetical protein
MEGGGKRSRNRSRSSSPAMTRSNKSKAQPKSARSSRSKSPKRHDGRGKGKRGGNLIGSIATMAVPAGILLLRDTISKMIEENKLARARSANTAMDSNNNRDIPRIASVRVPSFRPSTAPAAVAVGRRPPRPVTGGTRDFGRF